MVYWWCCGETKSEKKKREDDKPKQVEAFIEACDNLDPEDAKNIRKETKSNHEKDVRQSKS